jgi:hypothetical protein
LEKFKETASLGLIDKLDEEKHPLNANKHFNEDF